MRLLGASVATRGSQLTPVMPDDGKNGASAWTPMLAIEVDGTARYLKIVDWFGGTGAKPTTGYVGTDGVPTTKAKAPNLNAAKRIEAYGAVTRGTAGTETGTALAIGEKKIVFASAFTDPPRVIATARANITGRPVAAEVVAVTTTFCVVRASQAKGTLASLLATLFDLAGGISVDVLVIET